MANKVLYKKLGLKIKSFRKERNLTIDQLAEKANLNECFLDEIERGRKIPSIDTLVKLSKALNVDIYLLFKFE